MPCNGFGHSPECNCGWGGEYYEPSQISYSADYWQKERSHTSPNAACPMCGESVFFYRSPDGGSVYFESLGPPWPKHPCMDSSSNSARLLKPVQKKDGWWPYLCDQIWPLPGKEGVILFDGQDRWLVCGAKHSNFRHDTPIWIKAMPGGTGEYEISTLKTKNEKTYEVVSKCYNAKAMKDLRFAANFQETIAMLNKANQKS